MNKTYVVRVFVGQCHEAKEVYKNSIVLDEAVAFPFDHLVASLRLLYPRSSRIEFSVVY